MSRAERHPENLVALKFCSELPPQLDNKIAEAHIAAKPVARVRGTMRCRHILT
jgi:hypothetical protein